MNASPAAMAATKMPAERRVGRDLLTHRPEPVDGDRAADPDAEDETEELDERARRVRDAGLQVLARELPHPDRQPHAREERDERGERDEIR